MLKLNHVSMTFNPGTVNEKKALNDLSLHLAPGDFATIVGSNGAGKSTLFGAIAGSFWPDTGSVVLDGQDITFLPAHVRSKQIGHLFQDPMRGTAPHMTIEENLALAYLRTEKSKSSFFSRVNKKDKELFREHLALLGMGLEDRMSQPEAAFAGRAHRRAGPGHGREGAGADEGHCGSAAHHLPDDHPQYAQCPGAGQPHPDDERRADRAGCAGRRA